MRDRVSISRTIYRDTIERICQFLEGPEAMVIIFIWPIAHGVFVGPSIKALLKVLVGLQIRAELNARDPSKRPLRYFPLVQASTILLSL